MIEVPLVNDFKIPEQSMVMAMEKPRRKGFIVYRQPKKYNKKIDPLMELEGLLILIKDN